ncbi:MAG: ACT domain-containing protein [Clostridia bacterium]|nr:ACT domain-containing protein [Clostridia bacterium]
MRSVISVIGKDAVGITAKISAVCANRNVNIVDISQSVLKEDIFVMVMLTEVSDGSSTIPMLKDDFKKISDETGLDIRVIHEDVFNSMHKI